MTTIVDSKEQVAALINWSLRELQVKCIEYTPSGATEVKTFYPWSTQWCRVDDDEERRDYDPDIPCDGYFSHGDIDCEYQHDQDDDQDGDELDEKYSPTVYVNRQEDIKLRFMDETKLFQGNERVIITKEISMMNDMGCEFPTDHRGSNHMALDIDHLFDGMQAIKPGEYDCFDIARIIWRIKANKFDNQYECIFETEVSNVEDEDDIFTVSVPCDHGS